MPNPSLREELQALPPTDPSVDKLVEEIIGRVADKWTMMLIEILTETEVCRFKELSRACPGISQKMLTQTLRAMERDGLVERRPSSDNARLATNHQTPLGRRLAAVAVENALDVNCVAFEGLDERQSAELRESLSGIAFRLEGELRKR